MNYSIKKNSLRILCLLFFLSILSSQTSIYAQNNQEFKGKVIDADSKKSMALADLIVIGTNISTITNSEGEFLLKVPNAFMDKSVSISYLGYKKLQMPLRKFKNKKTRISLERAPTILAKVDVNVPENAKALVLKALSLKGENYVNDETVMTSFYRETIKKRNKNALLSEAVLKIFKQPYTTRKKDVITLIKARKKTDYSRLDTLALKLQGGPFSALQSDIIKHPYYVFSANNIKDYTFSFGRSTQINNTLVYVVNFKQNKNVTRPMYNGKLFIDANSYALTSATYNLDVSNKDAASRLFVRKKPREVTVYPTEASYYVKYRINNGKWYFGYSNILLTFKVKWEKKWFRSRYTLQSEMAITDWDKNLTAFLDRPKNRLKSNTILTDETSGFADPEFWGAYNIIEPEKSIESAINKISKQLKKS